LVVYPKLYDWQQFLPFPLPGFGKSKGSRGGADFLQSVVQTLQTDPVFK